MHFLLSFQLQNLVRNDVKRTGGQSNDENRIRWEISRRFELHEEVVLPRGVVEHRELHFVLLVLGRIRPKPAKKRPSLRGQRGENHKSFPPTTVCNQRATESCNQQPLTLKCRHKARRGTCSLNRLPRYERAHRVS